MTWAAERKRWQPLVGEGGQASWHLVTTATTSSNDEGRKSQPAT